MPLRPPISVEFKIACPYSHLQIKISTDEIHFGAGTIHESVYSNIEISNLGVLVEEIGFLDLPNFISVCPENGFCKILPGETRRLKIVFSPKKAENYSGKILMQSLRGFKHMIRYRGVGVKTPIEISTQNLDYQTALYDVERQNIFIENNHISADEFTHAVPRIGAGAVFPVGPTSFSFVLPEDSPVTISPSVGFGLI